MMLWCREQTKYQVEGFPTNLGNNPFDTPLFPEFDDPSLHTYLQPDLYVQASSTSASPFTLPLDAPLFPPVSTSSSSSVQVSPLSAPSMDFTPMDYNNDVYFNHPSSASPPKSTSSSHNHKDKDYADPTVAIKRQRNTLAARKYRQKRIDRIAELEGEVDQLKSEKEELRIKLARQEAETAALKEMLRAKGA
ncbi:hypothetical protein GE09DRAFT_1061992 [Coniochaeta sp. 2T2.1]|nr:hypothetical protein GE09DRAFT_1061992 [Coniochaeta sp. 2T2.1]